jgi:hypothetical protein
MSWLGYILAFMLGGSISFFIACIIAGGRLAEMLRENQRLKEQLDGHLSLKDYSVLIA